MEEEEKEEETENGKPIEEEKDNGVLGVELVEVVQGAL